MSQAISFYLGDESQLVIDSFESKKESIFNDSYNKVLKEISEYVKQNATQNSKKRDTFYSQTADVYVNNIFAFIGDRGTGKSSCMFSVANMLKDDELSKKSVECGVKFDLAQGFEILENIDPSFFDENTNILSIVLGRLFSNFKNAVDNDKFTSKYGYEAEKDELFKKFQEVKKSLTCLLTDKKLCEEDTIDELMNLTASVDLRKTMKSLLELYLKFFKKDFLVIPVDDIDLHTQCAYKMVEELRKYLRQEKVVILMALKLEQLQQVVEREFLSKHKEMLDKKMMTESDIIDMASKYLIKLIPEKNRIYLPTTDFWIDSEINIYKSDVNGPKIHNGCNWTLVNKDIIANNDVDNEHRENEGSNQTVKYYILSLIFQKTRYLFYSTKGEASPIIPRNLRELRHLIASLNNMSNYNHNSQGIYNKTLFKEYFLKTWSISNLDQKGCNCIQEIFAIKNPVQINKTIVKKLNELYGNLYFLYTKSPVSRRPGLNVYEKNDLPETEFEISRIINDLNNAYNISIGDVLFLLTFLNYRLSSKSDKMLIFAIETFYSIRLYEFYDLRTEQELVEQKKKMDKKVSESIKRKDILDAFHFYEILVGGSFYSPYSDYLIAPARGGMRRDFRKITKNAVDDVLNLYIKTRNYWFLQLVEFFVLMSSREDYTNFRVKGYSEYQVRQLNDVIFDCPFSTDLMKFDVMSLFANIVNVERQYNRFNKDLFKFAEENKESLYNKIIKLLADDRKETYSEQKLLSWLSIRNIEVLKDLILKARYDGRNKSGDNISLLKDFFEQIGKYEIQTYDVENGFHRHIDFRFANVFYNFLNQIIDNEKERNDLSSHINYFNKIFDGVASENKIVEPTKNVPQPYSDMIRSCLQGVKVVTAKRKLLAVYPELKGHKWGNVLVNSESYEGNALERKIEEVYEFLMKVLITK